MPRARRTRIIEPMRDDHRSGNKNYRVTKRPGKASGVMSAVVGGIFVLIGICVAIPSFGPFGVLWTLMAAAMCIFGVYAAFGKKYTGPEIRIESEEQGAQPEDAKSRLERLQELYDSGLISYEELEAKRRDIISEL